MEEFSKWLDQPRFDGVAGSKLGLVTHRGWSVTRLIISTGQHKLFTRNVMPYWKDSPTDACPSSAFDIVAAWKVVKAHSRAQAPRTAQVGSPPVTATASAIMPNSPTPMLKGFMGVIREAPPTPSRKGG